MSSNGTTALARHEDRGAMVRRDESAGFSENEVDLIKTQIAPGVTDGELKLFLHVCKSRQLDPFSRQIYAVVREAWNSDTRQKEKKMTIMTAIDGFRLNARRGGVEAIDEAEFEYDARQIANDNPLGLVKASVKVWRAGVSRPTVGVAYWDEYRQTKRDGGLSGKWGDMPRGMLAKCAEAQALRKAAPEELSGLYAPEEMDQASNEPRVLAPQPEPSRRTVAQVRNDVSDHGPGNDAPQHLTADEFAALKQQMEAAVEQSDLDDLDGKAEGWLSPEQNKEYRGHYAHMKNRIAKRKREAAATQDAAPESVK
jgi:phage recombination protein Bet